MYQEGDILLCTVERIEPTAVFVRLPKGEQGTLIISEIAPGRIKNLREYVVPNKKIVCKVLRISGDRVDVSLRRVSSKERSEVMEKFKQEQTAKSAFNQILKDKAKEVESKIIVKFSSLHDFLSKAKEDPSLIEKYVPKEFQESIRKIIQKKQKDVEAKKSIKIKSLAEDGILKVKKLLSIQQEKTKVIYLGAGSFSIVVKAENYKIANQQLAKILEDLEKGAKQAHCEFEVLEEKK